MTASYFCGCDFKLRGKDCADRLEVSGSRELASVSVTHRGSSEAGGSGRSSLTPVTLKKRGKGTINCLVQPDRKKKKKLQITNEKRLRRRFLICAIVCNAEKKILILLQFGSVQDGCACRSITTELSHGAAHLEHSYRQFFKLRAEARKKKKQQLCLVFSLTGSYISREKERRLSCRSAFRKNGKRR